MCIGQRLLIFNYRPNLMWRFRSVALLLNYTVLLAPCVVIIISIVAVILHFVTILILSPEVICLLAMSAIINRTEWYTCT